MTLLSKIRPIKPFSVAFWSTILPSHGTELLSCIAYFLLDTFNVLRPDNRTDRCVFLRADRAGLLRHGGFACRARALAPNWRLVKLSNKGART